jgi:hypothetical protein
MTSAMLDQPSRPRQRSAPVVQPARRRTANRGPVARPERSAPIRPARLEDVDLAGGVGAIARAHPGAVRSCRVRAGRRRSASWRLTDRGIALVLILTAMLVLAAVTVIGLTAWRVTGPEYQSAGVSQLSRR